jgi:hypothetical protein
VFTTWYELSLEIKQQTACVLLLGPLYTGWQVFVYFVSVYQFVVDYVSLYSSDKCSKIKRYSTQFGSYRHKTLVVIPLHERLLVCPREEW